MLHGNIYPAAKVPQALTHFFRTENLAALRELALRFSPTRRTKRSSSTCAATTSPTSGRPPRGSSSASPGRPGPIHFCDTLRLAARLKTELHVIHVTGDAAVSASVARRSRHCGPGQRPRCPWDELTADDPAEAIVEYARNHQITQIVLGSSRRSRWQEVTRGRSSARSFARLLTQA